MHERTVAGVERLVGLVEDPWQHDHAVLPQRRPHRVDHGIYTTKREVLTFVPAGLADRLDVAHHEVEGGDDGQRLVAHA